MKTSGGNHNQAAAGRSASRFVCAWTAIAILLSMSSDAAAAPRGGRSAAASNTSPTAAPSGDLAPALAAVRAQETRRIEVFARAAKTVVCIFSDNQRGGGGSGVIIDPEGYGLTNFHVVQAFVESRRGFGGLSDGRLYPLRVLGIDPGGDIVMFKLEGKQRFDYAPLGDSDTLRVGQWVAAMGNPFMVAEDFSPTITLGVISGLHRYQRGQGNLLEYADCIQVSTSINPGNSGGPLFGLEGRVIGINGRASFQDEKHRQRVNVGLGYAVSINQIKRFLPGLRAGRLLEHGTLGATVRTAGDELIVSAIQAFSAAEAAGVQLGDELLEVAGQRLRTPNDYNNILATLPADWPVTLRLRRDGQPIETTARLDRLPLRTSLLYVVDLEHNHAELIGVLDRHAERTGMRVRQPFSHVTFKGRIRSEEHAVERPFTVLVNSPVAAAPHGGRSDVAVAPRGGRSDAAADVSSAEPPGNAAVPQAPPDDPLDPVLRDEWRMLALPLLVRPQIDLHWELLAGDEVNGRIVNVVERRLDSGQRVRWKFDWQTDELLQVTISSGAASGPDEPPAPVVWSPASPESFEELRWPRIWTRRTPAGDEIVLEIESIEPALLTPNETPSDSPEKEVGR